MAQFLYAQNAELTSVLQNLLPERTLDDPVFTDIMRPRAIKEQTILWEQKDSFFGFTPARATGAGFGQIAREGMDRFSVTAVGYGEEKVMDEQFMLNSRQMGEFGSPIDLTEVQMSDQLNLISRFITRYKYNTWNLLTTGTYRALGPKGELVGQDSYTFASFTVAVAWSNYSSATPIADLRNLALKHRGQSAKFDSRARIYMQSQDVNNMLANTNPNDLGGWRNFIMGSGTTPLNLKAANEIFIANDLPQIVVYDEFYATGVGTNTSSVTSYTMYIPQGTAVAIGHRDYGEPVMDYTMVPTFGHVFGNEGRVTSLGEDSAWSNIWFSFELDMKNWNAKSRIAFSGAPRVLYPSAVCTVSLTP